MLDVVYGSGELGELENGLRESIQDLSLSGTLYFSYPIFKNASANGPTKADALLVSEEGGLMAFDLSARPENRKDITKWISNIENRQEDIYRNIIACLLKNKNFMHKRKYLIDPSVITIVDNLPKRRYSDDTMITSIDYLESIINNLNSISKEHMNAINSIIQGLSISDSEVDRTSMALEDYCGSIFGVANGKSAVLGQDQLQAALSCPRGPQRICGIPGSGKTTALALKAAHLHVANPNWKIAVTFRNPALEFHFSRLIEKFMQGINNGKPDWSNLHVAKAWGHNSFYDRVAEVQGIEKISRLEGRSRDPRDPFSGVFLDGVEQLADQSTDPTYDAILIDDAQELPPSFFQFAYAVARSPKRIVWAGDTFQSLVGYESCTPEELFGNGEDGQPKVSLKEEFSQPPQDITLGISYRNTPKCLTVAHALACGIHRQPADDSDDAVFRIYANPKMWHRIGYSHPEKNLAHGESITLRREPKGDSIRFGRSPNIKARIRDAVYFKSFETVEEQWKWMSKRISDNIDKRKTGLSPEDILIVFPDMLTAREEQYAIFRELKSNKILSNIVKTPDRRDNIVTENSVTIANVFNAKETEFPMVYFASAQKCLGGKRLLKMRNALFTGITRSKAWVRICGVGIEGRRLEEEFKCVVEDEYQLKFSYPTTEHIQRMKTSRKRFALHTKKEDHRRVEELLGVAEMIRTGKIDPERLPQGLVRQIHKILKESK